MTSTLTARQRLTLDADTAAELMSPPPPSLRAEATESEAVAAMAARGFTAAPVIDQAGRPVGVISRTDFLIHRGEKAPGAAESTVRDLMTPAVFSVTPQTPADQVVEQLVAMHVHQLFVVDDAQLLIGVVTAYDVLRRLRR